MRKIIATVDHVQNDTILVEAEVTGIGKVNASLPVLVVHANTVEGFAYAIRMVNPTDDELATYVEGAAIVIKVDISKE